MNNLYNHLINIYIKYKAVVLYIFFGVVTTIINIGTYYIFSSILNIDYLISNLIAWVFAILVAYITNKLYVFDSKSFSKEIIIKELTSFIIARIFSLIIDNVIMYVFVGLLDINDMIIKVASNFVVIILNYILSKFIIFKKKDLIE